MNKCKLAFMLSHIKKAIYNLERLKAYDNDIIRDEIIEELKENLILLEIKKEEED